MTQTLVFSWDDAGPGYIVAATTPPARRTALRPLPAAPPEPEPGPTWWEIAGESKDDHLDRLPAMRARTANLQGNDE